jgi:PleD family two-component response regulator
VLDKAKLTNARILVVDDEEPNVLLVERILQRAW